MGLKLCLLMLLLTSCASPVSAMSSPLAHPLAVQTQLPIVRTVAYMPSITMPSVNPAAGIECDSYLQLNWQWCPSEIVTTIPAKWLRSPLADWRTEEAVQGTYDFTVDDVPKTIAGFITDSFSRPRIASSLRVSFERWTESGIVPRW